MKNLDTYLSLCTEYYELDKPTAPQDALSFYLHYAQKVQGPILEPMCGTGRFLIPLMEQGFEIEGFDASPHMLAVLEKKCAAKKLKPQVWQQFLQDVDGDKQYSLIFIPGGSFSLITDPAHVALSLQKIFQHLRPSGIFVFDIETVHTVPTQLGIWHGTTRMRPDGSMIVASFLPSAPVNNIGTSIGRYDLIEKGQLLKTEFERYKLRFYDSVDMMALLQGAGFKKIHILKAYNLRAAPSEGDESIVFECTK